MRPRLVESLRDYLDELRRLGELVEIDAEVDWNLEMGAIIRRVYEEGAPAPLFRRIKGIEPQFRALGAPAGTSRQPGLYLARVALSLGLDARATGRDIIEALATARKAKPIPPRLVATGPCKENLCVGDAADLMRFPTPFPHDGDGGRYFGTWATIVARTPDGKWTNWSIARAMLIDAKRLTGIVHPLQHLGMIHALWKERGDWRSLSGLDAPTLCRRIGTHVFECSKFGAVIPKIIVVNDDIDATNTKEVVWAFATRCHPVAGEIHFDREATSPLVAFLEQSEKLAGRASKVVYNCLPPEDWGDKLPTRTSFARNYPEDLRARVLSRWSEYGFKS